MEGTTATRLARVATHLLTHPGDILPYLKIGIAEAKTPLELELPWISFAAIRRLQEIVRPGMFVFEYGSGGSTLFFARRGASVTSVEHHDGWREQVESAVTSRGLDNVNILLRPYDFFHIEDFDNSPYLRALDRPYDLILVDGQDEDMHTRPHCFRHAEQFIKPGGFIVVDDSWHYRHLRAGRRVEVCESVGPYRKGVTSTDIYFY